MLISADVSPVAAADARVERAGAKPGSAVIRRSPRYDVIPTIVRFLRHVQEGLRISLVTMAGRYPHRLVTLSIFKYL